MNLPYSNKDCVLKSPCYLSVNLLNQLNSDVQTIVTKGEFKKTILAFAPRVLIYISTPLVCMFYAH